MNTPVQPRRTLVAGVGNILLGDDGFGVETVRRLTAEPLPEHVEAVDIGVRGVHLAYRLLDGYDTFVLVDATARGGDPGTLYLIDASGPGTAGTAETATGQALLDGHRMSPDAVLALLGDLCAGTGGAPPRRTLVVGCEPACVEEGIGLSAPVAAAVPDAVRLVLSVLEESREPREPRDPGATQERNTSPC
ncbi:hydrogenase maturation protease [Streptomyces sp. NPDC004838]